MEFNGIAEGRKSNLMFTDILLSSSGEFDEETSFTAAGWNVEANAALMTYDGLLPSPFFGATTHVNATATATSPDSSMNFASSFSSMSSSSCSSDEDLDGAKRKATEEAQGGQLPPKRKRQQEEEDAEDENRRKRKGSATDPQSVYARKRRERINERLKILQNLVPNGTKVDISTMLEQAIQYVKFMQLQIKLLSSDEHWMYTPIAFNGCLPHMDTLQ